MITIATDEPVLIARADHPVDVNKLIMNLDDVTVITQGPNAAP